MKAERRSQRQFIVEIVATEAHRFTQDELDQLYLLITAEQKARHEQQRGPVTPR